jgi:hypothetical protein
VRKAGALSPRDRNTVKIAAARIAKSKKAFWSVVWTQSNEATRQAPSLSAVGFPAACHARPHVNSEKRNARP